MRITKKTGNSPLEELILVSEFVDEFNANRLLYAIHKKHCNEEEIVCITSDIVAQTMKLKKQYVRLGELQKTYNLQWHTEKKGELDTTEKVSRKIRSGLKGARDVFKKFCPRITRQLPNGTNEVQAVNVSYINSRNTQLYLWSIEEYPQCVKDLFIAMIDFYGLLKQCIEICLDIRKDESNLKDDRDDCDQLLQECLDKVTNMSKFLIKAIKDNPNLMNEILTDKTIYDTSNDNIIAKYKKSKDRKTFACENIHNFTLEDVNQLNLVLFAEEYKNKDFTASEIQLFNRDETKIENARYIIRNFDKLLSMGNVKFKRRYVPTSYIVALAEWLGVRQELKSTFLNYFTTMYNKGGGKYNVPKISAIVGQYSQNTKSGKVEKLSEIALLINPYLEERNKQSAMKVG